MFLSYIFSHSTITAVPRIGSVPARPVDPVSVRVSSLGIGSHVGVVVLFPCFRDFGKKVV